MPRVVAAPSAHALGLSTDSCKLFLLEMRPDPLIMLHAVRCDPLVRTTIGLYPAYNNRRTGLRW
uniref:Uncharacterized protein n=1 Tax=Arundo donax TaxID=35708 RepID=A0A0A8ZX97_ARUDO